MIPLPWNFEPCENEGPIRDPKGTPWQHAVRGRKPAGRLVMGYGHTEPAAHQDARDKAHQYDARETLGERGEVMQSHYNVETLQRFGGLS